MAKHMQTDTSGRAARRWTWAAAAGLFAAIAAMPGVAQAGKECSAFTVTITQGTNVRTVRPGTEVTLSNVAPGAVLRASGKFVRFEVDLDTLAVGRDVDAGRALLPYALTGAPTADADDRVTNRATTVFTSKVPNLGQTRLTGPVALRVGAPGSGELRIERSGGAQDMKIQAKDCSQGGIFQMEPDARLRETNVLAAGFEYCYQASAASKRFFTNFDVLGYDSPEGTTTTVQGFDGRQADGIAVGSERRAVWSVMGGGRVGMVIGEDALEALLLEAPAARTACRNDLLN